MMVKLTSIFLCTILFLTGTMSGQTLPNPSPPKQARTEIKETVSRETEKIKNESAALDVKQMNKMPRQVQKNNWSSTKTTLVVILAIVIVGAFYVIVKNTTRCVERYPDGCDLVNDSDCVCTRSER